MKAYVDYIQHKSPVYHGAAQDLMQDLKGQKKFHVST